ncbi:MAG: flagellar biosynthetic protein FliR [Anaerolineae bacterium]|nr:flagellar biosynthetic protein FliR [Phycisphaerae bacterium]
MAGLMVMSPLFGSAKIPKRVKVMFAATAALGAMSAITEPIVFPETLGALTLGIAGEIAFGAAMGMIVSFTFVAAQWAGEMIGQQIGFNLSEVFDPQFGQAGTLVGDMYFMLTLVIFLIIGGHIAMIKAVNESFVTAPLLSLTMDRPLFDTILDMFTSSTMLAMRLAAPMFFTMLVVDLAMGAISRAMPQFNIMTTGLSLRAVVGIVVMMVGITLTSDTLSASLIDSVGEVVGRWSGGNRAHG